MAQKAKLFHDAAMYTAILRTRSPKECKQLGRQVSNFDPSTWDTVRYEVLLTAIRAKFSQNRELKQALINTGDSIIAEASPYDDIFGIKMTAEEALQVSPDQWRGQNILGRALMDVRMELVKGFL